MKEFLFIACVVFGATLAVEIDLGNADIDLSYTVDNDAIHFTLAKTTNSNGWIALGFGGTTMAEVLTVVMASNEWPSSAHGSSAAAVYLKEYTLDTFKAKNLAGSDWADNTIAQALPSAVVNATSGLSVTFSLSLHELPIVTDNELDIIWAYQDSWAVYHTARGTATLTTDIPAALATGGNDSMELNFRETSQGLEIKVTTAFDTSGSWAAICFGGHTMADCEQGYMGRGAAFRLLNSGTVSTWKGLATKPEASDFSSQAINDSRAETAASSWVEWFVVPTPLPSNDFIWAYKTDGDTGKHTSKGTGTVPFDADGEETTTIAATTVSGEEPTTTSGGSMIGLWSVAVMLGGVFAFLL